LPYQSSFLPAVEIDLSTFTRSLDEDDPVA